MAVLIVLQDNRSKNMQVHKQRKATLHESAKYKGYFQGFFPENTCTWYNVNNNMLIVKKKGIIINNIRLY